MNGSTLSQMPLHEFLPQVVIVAVLTDEGGKRHMIEQASVFARAVRMEEKLGKCFSSVRL